MAVKINWKSPWTIGVTVVLSVAALIGIIALSFKFGQKDALEKELIAVNQQLQGKTSRANPDEYLKLLAKKKAIQDLLANI